MGVLIFGEPELAGIVLCLSGEGHIPAALVLARTSVANARAARQATRERRVPCSATGILDARSRASPVLCPVRSLEWLEESTRRQDGSSFLSPETARGLRLLRLAVGVATDTVVRLEAAELASIVAVAPPESRRFAAERLERISFINVEALKQQCDVRGDPAPEPGVCSDREILATAEGLIADPLLAEWMFWALGPNTRIGGTPHVRADSTRDTLGEIRRTMVPSHYVTMPPGVPLPPADDDYDAAAVALDLVREAARDRTVEERLQKKGIGLDTVDVAREIRREIREAVAAGKLPRAGYSVRFSGRTTHAAIAVTATNLPFDVLSREAFVVRCEGDSHLTFDRTYFSEYTAQAFLVWRTLMALVDEYHWDLSEYESDCHNMRFSKSVTLKEDATAWAAFTAEKVAQARAQAEAPSEQDEPKTTG